MDVRDLDILEYIPESLDISIGSWKILKMGVSVKTDGRVSHQYNAAYQM